MGQECFMVAQAEVERMAAEENLKMEKELCHKIWPQGECELFGVDCGYPKRQVQVGTNLPKPIRSEIQNILIEFQGIFSWSPTDSGTISCDTTVHGLGISDSPITMI